MILDKNIEILVTFSLKEYLFGLIYEKKLFPPKKLSDCKGTQTHNQFVRKQTLERTRTTLNTDTFYAVLTASFTDLVKLFFTIF